MEENISDKEGKTLSINASDDGTITIEGDGVDVKNGDLIINDPNCEIKNGILIIHTN